MKAITYRKYGPPSVLDVEDIAKPKASPDQYEVRIHAVEVTKADCELRSFRFPVKWFWIPLRLVLGIFKPRNPVLGGYFSGKISKASESDARFKVGDSVFGNTGIGFGAYGEYINVSATNIMIKMPESLSFPEAAAMPLGGLNAIHFMNIAQLRANQSILIIGAGGSIGLFAVQLAVAKGAKVTVVDKAAKKELLMQLGIFDFIDYQVVDFYSESRQFDVVFSMVANSPFLKNLKLVQSKGCYIMGNPTFKDMLLSVVMPLITGKRALFRFAKESEAELKELVTLCEAGQIKALVDSVLSMEEAIDAHEKVEQELRNGSIVIALESGSVD